MNACPFVRLIVESLALKLPPQAAAGGGYFCTVHLRPSSLPPQTTPLATVSDDAVPPPPSPARLVFHIDPSSPREAATKAKASSAASSSVLVLSVHVRRDGSAACAGGSKAPSIGKVRIPLDLKADGAAACRAGWAAVGRARLHVAVRSEPDPRYVFQFGGEPECSPVVYQVQESGARLQPVFSCRFNAHRRSGGSDGSLPSDAEAWKSGSTCRWFPLGSRRRYLRMRREQRKGWTVTIHDLSGSPVAAAAVITPFVPSPGSRSVSRSNAGAWLVLRPAARFPSSNAWSPWGRLEAWRERIPGGHALGYRFEPVVDPNAATCIPIVESKLCARKGGQFCIDAATAIHDGKESLGFVMASTVEGEGKVSRPTVQVGAQRIRCMADAAIFVALSAAVDLSMDACRLFSKKLRKELCRDRRNYP